MRFQVESLGLIDWNGKGETKWGIKDDTQI